MKWAIISDPIYINDDEGSRRYKRQRAKKTRVRALCSEPCLCERTLTRGSMLALCHRSIDFSLHVK